MYKGLTFALMRVEVLAFPFRCANLAFFLIEYNHVDVSGRRCVRPLDYLPGMNLGTWQLGAAS